MKELIDKHVYGKKTMLELFSVLLYVHVYKSTLQALDKVQDQLYLSDSVRV